MCRLYMATPALGREPLCAGCIWPHLLHLYCTNLEAAEMLFPSISLHNIAWSMARSSCVC
jgi:hypothetical protein